MKRDRPTPDQDHGEGDRVPARRTQRHDRELVARPQPTKVSLDELVAKGHTVIDRMEALARRIAGRLRRR